MNEGRYLFMARSKALPPELLSANSSPSRASTEPTSSARLNIEVGPDRVGGTAEGNVPPDQAHHLITTFGLMGSGVIGVGGAALTLSIAPHFAVFALAELALALAIAVLIAACGRG
jgi:hypothetical protein